jgi:small-conductance mechanosensitive channel
LEWQRGTAALQVAWLEFSSFFVQKAHDAFYGALAAWESVQADLSAAWINAAAFFGSTFTRFSADFQSAWESVINATTQGLLKLQGVFDDTFDSDAAISGAQKQSELDQQAIEEEKKRRLSENEANRTAAQAGNAKQRDDALKDINDRAGAAQKNLKDTNDADIAKTQAELDALQKKLRDLAVAAALQRPPAPKPDPDGGDSKDGKPPSEKDIAAGVAAAVKSSSAGTFSAFALQSLRGGGEQIAREQLEVQKRIAKNTAKRTPYPTFTS